ncbi:hypothetical protein [Sphingomonas sp.]|uniref:hypothetical protein n=1 Tax=Sphingomonas sp. TaxID=28214 RepID=UPI0035C86C40
MIHSPLVGAIADENEVHTMTNAASDENNPLIEFEPIFDGKQMREAEEAAKSMDVQQRIALALATKNRSQLTEMILKMAEEHESLFFEMVDGLKDLVQHYEECIELFKSVEAPLLIAAHQAFEVNND